MPKKRFTSQYSKPQSTVHPSLNTSPASAGSSKYNNGQPSVNDLISTLRQSQNVSNQPAGPSLVIAPTLPPQIRHLLSHPETPTPAPRPLSGRRIDANGRRIPAGPAPPRSWLEAPRLKEIRRWPAESVYPTDVENLPWLGTTDEDRTGNSLRDTCLREMATNWDFIKEYERNNLAHLPTRLRMLLLSYIAVYGPDDGVGSEAFNDLLVPPLDPGKTEESTYFNGGGNNEDFYRLDLSRSIGRSISFKQLTEIIEKKVSKDSEAAGLAWDDLPSPISLKISHLTHLSISYPPPIISWPHFLAFSKHVPTLTHLCMAYWPAPSLTPNSKSAMMSSRYGKDMHYGATNYYSHSLDGDFGEAAMILKRIATTLYGLEYIDLTGCTSWVPALRWKTSANGHGIDWRNQWSKMRILVLSSGEILHDSAPHQSLIFFKDEIAMAVEMEKYLIRWGRRGNRWIEVRMTKKGPRYEFEDEVKPRRRNETSELGATEHRNDVELEELANREGHLQQMSVWEE